MPYACFPTPIEGELPYSMLARYADGFGFPGSRCIISDAFGTRQRILATAPKNLRLFAATAFPGLLTADHLLRCHTGYPYQTAFLPQGARDTARTAMIEAGPNRTGLRLGRRHGMWGASPYGHLVFCPDCAAADVGEHGQAAWRRVHQLPGVVVCPRHWTRLRSGTARTETPLLIACPTEPDTGVELSTSMPDDVARGIAAESLRLLEYPLPPADPREIALALRHMLLEAGWRTRAGVASSAFAEHVLDRVGRSPAVWGTAEERLLAGRVRSCWQLISGSDTHPPAPFLHVAVLVALGRTVGDLYDTVLAIRTGAITVAVRKGRSGAPVADEPLPGGSRVALHRRRLLDAMRAEPRLGRTGLQRQTSSTFFYLRRHDPAWLEAHLPRVKRQRDWQGFDALLAVRIQEAANRLRNRAGKPRRVSAAALAREVGERQFARPERTPARMPLTRAALAEAVETPEAFALRRMQWVAMEQVRHRLPLPYRNMHRQTRFFPHLRPLAERIADAAQEALWQADPDTALVAALKDIALRGQHGGGFQSSIRMQKTIAGAISPDYEGAPSGLPGQ